LNSNKRDFTSLIDALIKSQTPVISSQIYDGVMKFRKPNLYSKYCESTWLFDDAIFLLFEIRAGRFWFYTQITHFYAKLYFPSSSWYQTV